MGISKPQAVTRITRTLRLESSLWTQLTKKSAQASLDAGRRISVNALIRRAIVDHFDLKVSLASDEARQQAPKRR